MAEPQAGARVPGRRRARRAATGFALVALAVLSACGEEPIPPLPQAFRSLDDQEASCSTCHDGRGAEPLTPGQTATPSWHPQMASLQRILERIDPAELPDG